MCAFDMKTWWHRVEGKTSKNMKFKEWKRNDERKIMKGKS